MFVDSFSHNFDRNKYKDYFGDVYDRIPEKFEFKAGDLVLMSEVANHVPKMDPTFFQKQEIRKRVDVDSQHQKEEFKVDTSEIMVESLKKKLKVELQNTEVDFGVPDNSKRRQVTVRVDDQERYRGQIACGLCEIPISAYLNVNSATSMDWVLSNYSKHLTNVHKLKKNAKQIPMDNSEIKY